MNIQAIIKKAVKRVELEGKTLTPEFYAEAFCKEAKKAGFSHGDCSQVDSYKNTLNKDFKKELENYNIKTTSELIRYLISKLNRTNKTHCNELLDSQTLLTKRILKTIELLHNKQATILALKTAKMLSGEYSVIDMEQFKQLWINFIESYDDTFLNAIDGFDKSDLKKSIEKIKSLDLNSDDSAQKSLTRLSQLFISSLVPSISHDTDKTLRELAGKIKNNPNIFASDDTYKEIRKAISLRIALDKESVKEMISSLDGVLDKLSSRLIEMIDSSDSSNDDIKEIKSQLESYSTASEKNFKTAHQKLFTIALALEKNTSSFSKELHQHNDDVQEMSQKIKELEKELAAAKEASKEDFLTKLHNKRSLDEQLKIKEEEFERYSHNYSIVMFDLDHFKSVNDTYGHAAGDAVLAAFAKIIKSEARSVDIIGRYGGEEFMAILEETDCEGGVVFAEKVRAHVQRASFLYKGTKIDVTVSCGVSERKQNLTQKSTINSADEHLYKAKTSGRNRVSH